MIQQAETLDMESVYQTYFPTVYNYVYYKLLNRENTEDIVSQVFIKVLRHLSNFDPGKASVKTWILRITDNTLTDFYRRQRPSVSIDNEENGLDNVLNVHFDEQYDQAFSPTRRAVQQALAQLPERDRMFIYYKYFEGITNREIARMLDMNENTVAATLSRARQKLKTVLGEAFGAE